MELDRENEMIKCLFCTEKDVTVARYALKDHISGEHLPNID